MLSITTLSKNNIEARRRQTPKITVEYAQLDKAAQQTAIVGNVDQLLYSNKQNVINNVTENYIVGTLEMNEWKIGTHKFYDKIDASAVFGCRFATLGNDSGIMNVSFPITTTENINCSGIKIVFDTLTNQYAIDFDIICGNKTYSIRNNSQVTYQLNQEITGTNTIAINIKKWCKPNTRAKLSFVQFGNYIYLNNYDLIDLQFTKRCKIDTSAIQENDMSFSFLNARKEYNPYQLTMLQGFVIEGQDIKLFMDDTLIGCYGVSGKPTVTDYKITVNTSDVIKLTDKIIEPTLYVNKSIKYIYGDLLNKCGIENYDTLTGDYCETVIPCIIVDGKARDIINNIALANKRNIYTYLSQNQTIGNADITQAGNIEYTLSKNLQQNISVEVDKLANKYVCNYCTWQLDDAQTILKTFTPADNGTYVIDIPYAANVTVSGGDLQSTTINTATIVCTANVKTTVNGYQYRQTNVAYTKDYARKEDITKTIALNPFILSNSQADSVISWLDNIYQQQQIITATTRGDYSLCAGDWIDVETTFGNYPIFIGEVVTRVLNGGAVDGRITGRRGNYVVNT